MKLFKTNCMMQKQIWIIFILCFAALQTFAQNIGVKGKVTDDTNTPLVGVSVLVQGTMNVSITDLEGNFSLENVSPNAKLEVSYVGMTSQTISVNGRKTINVVLKEDTEMLGEVVVVGYSTQSRSEMTTSISKLDTKVLKSAPHSNAATALQGTIPGLKVTQTTGQPGSTPKMQLRGGTSWDGSGSPLILIDGVPGSFYALNADDIESMEVLKDAASTAIYGARAANGVVLITTKKGKKGHSNISFKARLSSNQHRPDKMKYLSARDYIWHNRLAVKNYTEVTGKTNFDGYLNGVNGFATGNNITDSYYTVMYKDASNEKLLSIPGWHSMKDPLDESKTIIYQDNDLSEFIYQNSYSRDYGISIDGGGDKGTYYMSLGYLDDVGLILNSGFKRISGAFNASYNITDALKVSSNIIYAHSNLNKPIANDRDIFSRYSGFPPTGRQFYNNPDGTFTDRYHPGSSKGFGNILYYKDKVIATNLEQRLTASVQLDYKFLEDFNLTVRGSHFAINNSDEAFDKAYLHNGNLNTQRRASAKQQRTLRNQLTALLNYRKSFNEKHNVSSLIGTEFFEENYFGFNAATRFSPTDLIPTLNAGSEANGVPSSSKTGYSIASVFGQINYDYDYKYLLGFTFRYDGTSRLANDKYGFFPGISAGWNVHNEDFFKSSKLNNIVSKLKPRISYGVNGNIDILSNYGVFGLYGLTSVYDGQTGYANTQLPLLDLKWERSTTLNFGVDLGLFDNRVTLMADYFIRDVNDKLAPLTLPLWTGFSSITTNNGTLQNRGFEMEIKANIIKTKDWNWNVGTSIYTVKNYAKALPNNGNENNRQGGVLIWDEASGKEVWARTLEEGKRVGYDEIVAYVFDGVYQTQEQLDAHKGRVVEFATKKDKQFLGDARWKDLNGDNVINHLDRKVIGRATPSLTGGITSDLSYKNFNLFIKGDFAVGHMILNGRRLKGLAQTQGNQNGPSEILDTWSTKNAGSNMPRYTFVDPQRNYKAGGHDEGQTYDASSLMWEKGDYFALREVTLSYTLPGDLAKGIFQDARLFFSATNLAYISGYSGSSPEESNYLGKDYWGVDRGRFPLPRTYTIGINVTF